MEDYCVVCGAIVPEGLQVCPICEIKHGIRKDNNMEMCILLASSSVSELQSTAKSEQGKITHEEHYRKKTSGSCIMRHRAC